MFQTQHANTIHYYLTRNKYLRLDTVGQSWNQTMEPKLKTSGLWQMFAPQTLYPLQCNNFQRRCCTSYLSPLKFLFSEVVSAQQLQQYDDRWIIVRAKVKTFVCGEDSRRVSQWND